MAAEPFSPDSGPPPEPWAQDPEAWRKLVESAPAPDACAPARAWPQLDAAPAYWMWLERLERESGRPH
jgi:hypothetical protein